MNPFGCSTDTGGLILVAVHPSHMVGRTGLDRSPDSGPAPEPGFRDRAVCLFCGDEIEDHGLGFYAHVETHPACEFRWKDWMEEIPKDHGGA